MQLLTIIIVLMWQSALASECPVTLPDMQDPPGALKTSEQAGWHGSNNLAAMIPVTGSWNGMGPDHQYRDKFWWWHQGYDAMENPDPALVVTATSLDDATTIQLERTTNASTGSDNYEWDSMLTMLWFPSPGCWEVVGKFEEHQLRLVLSVGEY